MRSITRVYPCQGCGKPPSKPERLRLTRIKGVFDVPKPHASSNGVRRLLQVYAALCRPCRRIAQGRG